jgi:rsbT co-antagonist protein RsbR
LQTCVIDAQRAAIRELSTPLIPLTGDAVAFPLVGSIDSVRAQQLIEAVLEGVVSRRAEVVLLDVTGVSLVDTQVAQGTSCTWMKASTSRP